MTSLEKVKIHEITPLFRKNTKSDNIKNRRHKFDGKITNLDTAKLHINKHIL